MPMWARFSMRLMDSESATTQLSCSRATTAPKRLGPGGGRPGRGNGYYFTHMEGSLRVPFIIRWPGHIPAGRISNEIVHEVDTFTTFARMAGTDAPKDRMIDGVDQTDFFLGKHD